MRLIQHCLRRTDGTALLSALGASLRNGAVLIQKENVVPRIGHFEVREGDAVH